MTSKSSHTSARRHRIAGLGDVYTVLLLAALIALITAIAVVAHKNSQITGDSNPLTVHASNN